VSLSLKHVVRIELECLTVKVIDGFWAVVVAEISRKRPGAFRA
jgi:hypothetical protein